jgi:hypothetical protein
LNVFRRTRDDVPSHSFRFLSRITLPDGQVDKAPHLPGELSFEFLD